MISETILNITKIMMERYVVMVIIFIRKLVSLSRTLFIFQAVATIKQIANKKFTDPNIAVYQAILSLSSTSLSGLSSGSYYKFIGLLMQQC